MSVKITVWLCATKTDDFHQWTCNFKQLRKHTHTQHTHNKLKNKSVVEDVVKKQGQRDIFLKVFIPKDQEINK